MTSQNDRVYRESVALAINAATAVVALSAGGVFAFRGQWSIATALLAVGIVYCRFCFLRAVVKTRSLLLHEFVRTRSIPLADISWIDPQLKGTWMRTPRIGMRSGEMVRLDSFRVPTLMIRRSRAAERLAADLGIPAPLVPKTAPGWFDDPHGKGLRWWNGEEWTGITLLDVSGDAEDSDPAGRAG